MNNARMHRIRKEKPEIHSVDAKGFAKRSRDTFYPIMYPVPHTRSPKTNEMRKGEEV